MRNDRGANRPRFFRQGRWMLSCSVLLLVLAIVLALVSRGRGEASPLRVAAGASGGAFHPVAGNFVPDGTKLADCRGDPRCLQQAFGNISYANGPGSRSGCSTSACGSTRRCWWTATGSRT